MINKFYILAGFTLGIGAYSAIAKIRTDVKLKKVSNEIKNLKTECAALKKEKIDDWVDAASDILEGQQDSIDRLQSDVGDLIVRTRYQNKDIDTIEDDIKEIKEILEKTAGVRFNKGDLK